MQTPPLKLNKPIIHDLVVALFTESHSAHGAIQDLIDAGFHRDQIAVALSEAGEKATRQNPNSGHWGEQPVPSSQFSLAWKLRHWFNQDLHRRGAEQLTAANKTEESDASQAKQYTQVDLTEALTGLGVNKDRILLIDQILGRNGVLVLVEAADHVREVQRIFEKNSGQIRTDMATEYSVLLEGLH